MLRRNAFEISTLAVAAIIISFQLFIPPVIGMADNGDFIRFFTKIGLDHVPTENQEKYLLYFNSKYRIVARQGIGRYQSSTELPVRAARLTGIYFIDNSIFDIRLLGAVYTLLYLFGFYLLLVASRGLTFAVRLWLTILLTLILTDASYIACFNSFYSEPTALVFFLIAAGCALTLIGGLKRVWLLLVYFAASAMLVISKPMYAPFAIPLAALGFYLSRMVDFKKRGSLSVALAVLLCALGAVYYLITPQWLRTNAAYIGVFTETLKDSPTPEQDLSDMGLNPEWAQFAGTNPYAADSPLNDPVFKAEFIARAGSMTVPRFYLSRPSRLYEIVRRCSRLILTMPYLGYYEKATGRPPYSQPFGMWSEIRNSLFPKSVWTLFAFLSFGIAATVFGIIRAKTQTLQALFIFYGFLIVVAAAQFFIPVLTIGETDLARYLNLFNLAFDSSLALISAAILQRLFFRASALKKSAP